MGRRVALALLTVVVALFNSLPSIGKPFAVPSYVDPRIQNAIKSDPSGTLSFLPSLSHQDKRSFFRNVIGDVSAPPFLQKPHVSLNVEVILVGFNGEGEDRVVLSVRMP